ncbi:histidine kinase [Chryseobacterium sp. KBW03]|uniref:histidine kinase n=1 Tax=Chryseobacterium sp. KBW03 TaxID=2153362 RepID=UPI000F599156|nr:histidine kinase [Chryseobacterium sp. KBW03]RQO33768.1 histidine kinase [Chryseobacterium sp. KBW03]
MRTEIQTYFQIEKNLQLDFPKMTEYERLSLAIQIQRNQILENGLVVTTDNSKPSALEAVSIALGYTSPSSITITDSVKDLINTIEQK